MKRIAGNLRLQVITAIVALVGLAAALMPLLEYRSYMATVSDSELAVGTITQAKGLHVEYGYTVDDKEYTGSDDLNPESPPEVSVGAEIQVLYDRQEPARSYTPHSTKKTDWQVPFGIGLVVMAVGIAGFIASRHRPAPAADPEPEEKE